MCEPGGNRLGEPGLCPRRREQPPPWFLRWPPASRPPPPAARFAALGLDPGVQRERAAAGAVRRTGPPASLQDAAWHGSPDISTLAADRTFLHGCNTSRLSVGANRLPVDNLPVGHPAASKDGTTL